MDERINLFRRSNADRITGRAVLAIDIGTKNMACMRIVREQKSHRRLVTHAAIVNLRDHDGSETIDVIANNIMLLLLSPEMEWLWHPVGTTNTWKHYLTVEVQPITDAVNRRKAAAAKEQGGEEEAEKAEKKQEVEKRKPPIMYAIYGMLRMMAAAVQSPAAYMPGIGFAQVQRAGIDISRLGNPDLVFVPRVGGQKLGMKDLRGNDRKTGNALDVGIELMEEEGDDEPIAWMESLSRVKPLQDANDAYCQASHYLAELENEEVKQDKKRKREEEAAEKKQGKKPKGPPRKRAKKMAKKEEEEEDEDFSLSL